MLSFDLAIVVFVWAMVYILSDSIVVKFLAKYVFLYGVPIVFYQMLIDYGQNTTVSIMLYVTIVVAVLMFILDVIFYIPKVIELVREQVWR